MNIRTPPPPTRLSAREGGRVVGGGEVRGRKRIVKWIGVRLLRHAFREHLKPAYRMFYKTPTRYFYGGPSAPTPPPPLDPHHHENSL